MEPHISEPQARHVRLQHHWGAAGRVRRHGGAEAGTYRGSCSGLMVQGSGFRILDLGFRV